MNNKQSKKNLKIAFDLFLRDYVGDNNQHLSKKTKKFLFHTFTHGFNAGDAYRSFCIFNSLPEEIQDFYRAKSRMSQLLDEVLSE
jgi:hypothetical protein